MPRHDAQFNVYRHRLGRAELAAIKAAVGRAVWAARGLDGHGQGLLQGGGGLLEQSFGLEGVVAATLDDGRQAASDLQGRGGDVSSVVGGKGMNLNRPWSAGTRRPSGRGCGREVEIQRSAISPNIPRRRALGCRACRRGRLMRQFGTSTPHPPAGELRTLHPPPASLERVPSLRTPGPSAGRTPVGAALQSTATPLARPR